MFFTQPAAEFRPPLPFDLEIKRWAVIEHELEDRWFQLSLTLREGGMDISRTMLIANIEHLAQILDSRPASTRVNAVMMMTSPKINGSNLWQLLQVLSIDADYKAGSERGRYLVVTERGAVELPASSLMASETIYTSA
ncbi:hypothetical protein BWR59_02770 [Pseudomonas sp. Bc-h]|uniref:hypothetical protein n=1 Tax=Pseudomonas sp. Bc-h TaxID=1943632 RepID=UPI0009D92AFC|nr:hypothetical protein [Pseudomonas sp. Bc-h]OQR36617.1 hypothetical protein BWR59_02770 [Pseudomonas sp. Bc-h]